MHTDLKLAQAILAAESCTCVLCKGAILYKSTQRGIRPLLEFLEAKLDLTGFCAADKVVGKATAFLYCLLKVKAVYAPVMSEPALAVLEAHGIEASCGITVPAIRNRAGDGFCPMETATLNARDPQEALKAIREALKHLR